MSSSRNLVVSAVMLCMWLASFALLQGTSHFDTGRVVGGERMSHAAVSASTPAVACHHDDLSADIEDDSQDYVCFELAPIAFRAPPRAGIAERRGLECVRSQWLALAARGPPLT